MFENIDDIEEDVDLDGEDASDVEMVDDSGDDEAGSEDGSDESDEDSSGSELGSEMDEREQAELDEFDAKLAQALGTRRADQDLAVQDEESSDEDMDDDEMEALDTQLEQVFKARKAATSAKKEKKEAKQNVVLFKSRVLELLEIYVKKEHLSLDALRLVEPLLDLIDKTTSKDVSKRACTLIHEFVKAYRLKLREEMPEDDTTDFIKEILNKVHARATRKGRSLAHHKACSQASLLLAKALVSNHGEIGDVEKIYYQTETKIFKDPDWDCKDSFFIDWLNWKRSVRHFFLKPSQIP
jgi:DNA polymerase phi